MLLSVLLQATAAAVGVSRINEKSPVAFLIGDSTVKCGNNRLPSPMKKKAWNILPAG